MVQTKVCSLCGVERPKTDYYRRPDRGPDAVVSRCKTCSVKTSVAVRKKYAEHVNAYNRDYVQRLRLATLSAYSVDGTPACRCCGEDTFVFLALDHIDGGGNAHRKQFAHNGVYRELRRRGYPDHDKYQVLCHNCNWAKYRGGCPHGTAVGK